ncbi:hypothetical protein VNO80_02359 [Phaseolus coccineus]|uniref:Uncharacterized protein n=1 Tax=Phaseolus coccineus TaxID=3886 RepID=A0AAN9RMB4_PHACN
MAPTTWSRLGSCTRNPPTERWFSPTDPTCARSSCGPGIHQHIRRARRRHDAANVVSYSMNISPDFVVSNMALERTHNSDNTEAACENGTLLVVHDHRNGDDGSQINHGVKENETSGVQG